MTVAFAYKLLAHLQEVFLKSLDTCLKHFFCSGDLQGSLFLLAYKPVLQIPAMVST